MYGHMNVASWPPWPIQAAALRCFGASAPGTTVLEKFGYTVENVVARALALRERVS